MKFFRVYVGKKSGVVRHVVEQNRPFEMETIPSWSGEDLEVHDLGAVVAHDWTEHAPGKSTHGKATNPSNHVWTRIGHDDVKKSLTFEQARDVLRAHPEMPEFQATPCTYAGLDAHLRARGPRAIPEDVRTWLTLIKPAQWLQRYGIRRASVTALRRMALTHSRQDPQGHDLSTVLARMANERRQMHVNRRLEAKRAADERSKAAKGEVA